MRFYVRSLLCTSFLLSTLPGPGQIRLLNPAEKAPPYTVGKIVFQGQTPYAQQALEAASGLKAGAPLTEPELHDAAERLISTGAFDDVEATLDGPMKSISVIFKVKAVGSDHILRVSFDNFAWFSHDELTAGVQRYVPLFNGTVPEGGNEQDSIQNALQQMLAAKGVKGTVVSELVAPNPGQPFRMAEYRVQSPSVQIHQLDIQGVPANFTEATNKAIGSLTGKPYNDGLVGGLSDRILADYRNAGYLEATLSGLNITVASSTETSVEVNVTATLHAGEPYRVAKLEWAGSPLMSAEAFDAAAKLHTGEVASQQRLRESLENLDAAYRDAGYMDVALDATPKLDTASHQATFTVAAVPGPQYKLRKLDVLNLSPEQRSEFDSAWKLHPGDVYNAGYVTTFLKNNSALQTLKSYSASFKATEDPETGLLDLEISFYKGGTKQK